MSLPGLSKKRPRLVPVCGGGIQRHGPDGEIMLHQKHGVDLSTWQRVEISTDLQNRWRLAFDPLKFGAMLGGSAAAVFQILADWCLAWYGSAVVMEDRMHCLTNGAHLF